MRNSPLAVFVLLFCSFLAAQQALNNDAIVKLVKAGLSDDLIVSTINAQAGNYDTSPDGLIALKTAGVSDKVVAAVVAKAAGAAPTVLIKEGTPAVGGAANAVPAGANDPNSPHPPGMYIDSGGTMTLLAPTAYTTKSSQSLFNNSSVKVTAIAANPHAAVQSSDPGAVFFFYTSSNDPSLPSEFVLLPFQSSGNNRGTDFVPGGLMKAGEFSGSLSFASAQIAPGVYKLTPNAPLQAGEYCFFPDAKWYAAPVRQRGKLTATVHLFDFGIK